MADLRVLASCLLFPSGANGAADSFCQKVTTEGKQLREEGRYEEAQKAILLGLAETEKYGPEGGRVVLTVNTLAALSHAEDLGPCQRRQPLTQA